MEFFIFAENYNYAVFYSFVIFYIDNFLGWSVHGEGGEFVLEPGVLAMGTSKC